MAMSNGNGDFLVHSNGSIPSNATGLSTTSSTDGDITASPNQQSPKEVQRTKHPDYPAVCQNHSPVHQTTCCLQPSPSFCLHHRWQDHFQHQPVQPCVASMRPARPFRFPKSYAALIADWPVVVLGVCTVLIVLCALVGILVPDLPEFSDPLLGFEPRGTAIGQRLVTWNNMVKNTGYKATLANYPFKYADEQAKSYREDRRSDDYHERDKRQADWNFHKDSFFCDVPDDRYSRVVFTSAEGKNLWSIQAIKSMCNLDNARVRSHPQYRNLCQRTTNESCCPSWTLGNYIAILNNRSSCQKITERDVSHTLKILRSCAKYYHNSTLGPDCWDMATRKKDQLKCTNVPRKCTKYNAVYQILHFVVDKDFLSPKTADYVMPALKYSMLFSPTEKGESMMNIYLDNFENWNCSDGITTITGIEFGIKHNLFQDYLLMDTKYPAIAIVIVLLVMCVYTKSMFITLMTMFAIISSLIVSYFLYCIAFNFEFFPFMNLTALIILVGIGADDAFVLCDVWNYTKFDKPNADLSQTVSITLQHAALSMFVTSFTTAAAFYANYVSNITAIRCFGVYAGTAILVNYILMVTWLPAVVVLHERYLLNTFSCVKKPQQRVYNTKSYWTLLCQKINKFIFTVSEASRIFFEKVLPCIVIKFRYIWLFWFLAFTVGGAYIVCVNPKMKLPSLELSEFQVFRSSHPFERYDAEYKKLFMFERVHHGEELHMPITIIWGITPEDNGDPLNPKNKGKLTLDSDFNIASPASQLWILNFCQKLRNQTFFYQTDEQDFTSCFIETFKQWMENQDCDEATVYPCCSQSIFPYKQEVFELCIKRAIMELERSTGYHLDSKTPGPRFDINDTIRAVVLEFQSTYLFTLAYEKMHQFYREVDAWIKEELKSAPAGLSHGWFVSNLEFYDLQDSLSDGTLIAMGLSVGVAFTVMLLTTWNIIISLYAIISIAGTIFVTVGSLVLLGWELNVLESVTISVAVGLSVDFAVHYGVAYRLAPEPDREGKVVFSLSHMGSAIAMAALTTFVAGAMMMPSTVLAYTQLGTFMMLIMVISWAFATFFFQCMCRCIGPQGTCGQIPLPKKLQCHAYSPPTSTTSATRSQSKLCQMNTYQLDPRDSDVEHEHYELEPLASHSCRAVEKTTSEETQVCTRLYNGRPKHTCTHKPYNKNDLDKSGTTDHGFQCCSDPPHMCQYSSLNMNCNCVDPYQCVGMQWKPHSCQQIGDCLCSQCIPHTGKSARVQNPVSTLDTPHPALECLMHHVQHAHPHHHACLQGRGKRHSAPNSLLRNYCVHSVHQLQQQLQQHHHENVGAPEPQCSRCVEEHKAVPKDTVLSAKKVKPCRGVAASQNSMCQNQKECGGSGENNDLLEADKTISQNTDNCDLEQKDHSENKPGGPDLSQKMLVNEEEHVKEADHNRKQNSPQSTETAPVPCSEKSQCFNRTLKVKCNSRMPKAEAKVPAVSTNSQPSSESLC
ncbi:protein dispatched homolog 1-like isoform X2 [Acipenser ruthenus]|uniref:protein dispatched homolog 1-like isoform X2 n=1 Tax=Acipenser ruthenus TaxID=7906 RepID=UPI0027403AC5|nr:protein dispatched homolog 1-like isoform X2 [Acipenser ruthenus]